MSSLVVERTVAPTHRHVPAATSSAGAEAVELAASAGLHLDDWQARVLQDALGERADGKWSAFEVGIVVPRQNGKGAILEARELAGLFLFGERLILHSAHEFKTAQEAFLRVLSLVQNTPDLERLVHRVRTSHGEEGIELKGGQRLRFVARTGTSSRGFSADCVILDEAFNLPTEAVASMLPTLSARPNPQLWYTSSAPLTSSEVLRKLCLRGREGSSPALAYFEFCARHDQSSDDREAWRAANPALGIRVSEEFVENEFHASADESGFRRERLGIWFEDETQAVIESDVWKSLADPQSRIEGARAFAVDVSPDRKWTSIAVSGRRADGERHIEIVDRNHGTRWVVPRLLELVEKWKPIALLLDPAGPAGRFVADLEEAGVEFTAVGARDVAQACGLFYDSTMGDDVPVHHIDQPSLNAAVAAGTQRPLGDAWAWNRKSAADDISPLVASTLALWAVREVVDPTGQVW